MNRNFAKINESKYILKTESEESDESMEQRGYVKISDEEFDRLFLLYQKVIEGSITNKDIVIVQQA